MHIWETTRFVITLVLCAIIVAPIPVMSESSVKNSHVIKREYLKGHLPSVAPAQRRATTTKKKNSSRITASNINSSRAQLSVKKQRRNKKVADASTRKNALKSVSVGHGDVSSSSNPEKIKLLNAMHKAKMAGADSNVLSLQDHVVDILKKQKIRYGAIVVLDPRSGQLIAMAEKSPEGLSPQVPELSFENIGADGSKFKLLTENTFPAASLFKMVTAAAAIETANVSGRSKISYRGGDYTLNRYNYLPNPKKDTRSMTLDAAMAKSCNPVFGRVALRYLDSDILGDYASSFGFGRTLMSDLPLKPSTFSLAKNDDFETARTAAGFGDAYISPIHAALMVAAVGNHGLMMKPYLRKSDGPVVNGAKGRAGVPLLQVVKPDTASKLISLMEDTVSSGTGRRVFSRASKAVKNTRIAAKTGSLSGKQPKGKYYWFVAVAPIEAPEIAVATLVIDDGGAKINGVGLGRLFFDEYFNQDMRLLRANLKESALPKKNI